MDSRGRLFGFGREASAYGVAVLLISSLVWQPAVARDRGGRSDGIGPGLA
jgi:drug/metabolite transporter superfamily protein YnfA